MTQIRTDHLHNGTNKNIFQYCLNSDNFIHNVRVIGSHYGGIQVHPSLLGHVEIPYIWTEYIYHVGSSLALHSIILSGLLRKSYD